MNIMTENGWRPLVDFSDYWAKKRARLDAARDEVETLRLNLPIGGHGLSEEEARDNHLRVMAASNRYIAALDAMIN